MPRVDARGGGLERGGGEQHAGGSGRRPFVAVVVRGRDAGREVPRGARADRCRDGHLRLEARRIATGVAQLGDEVVEDADGVVAAPGHDERATKVEADLGAPAMVLDILQRGGEPLGSGVRPAQPQLRTAKLREQAGAVLDGRLASARRR